MRVLEIDQNTEEWEEFRKGKSGGSAFYKIFKAGGRSNGSINDQFFKMLAERVARPMTPNDYMDRVPDGVPFSWAVRGHILEEDAAKLFAERYHKNLKPGYVWMSGYDENSYVSPDRAIVNTQGNIREAVEIKCLSSEKVLKIWYERMNMEPEECDFDILPSEYQSQVLKYFMVNEGLKKLYWVLYTDLIPGLELQVLEINKEDVRPFLDQAVAVEKSWLEELKKCEKMLENY